MLSELDLTRKLEKKAYERDLAKYQAQLSELVRDPRFLGRGETGRADHHPHALELVAREDRGALQAGQQRRAAQRDVVLVALGDDAVVVGELALDQLGHELHAREAELGLVAGKAQQPA